MLFIREKSHTSVLSSNKGTLAFQEIALKPTIKASIYAREGGIELNLQACLVCKACCHDLASLS